MQITGRCYCGHVTVTTQKTLTAAYCHCSDCRRWTGSPIPAFAAFASVTTDPVVAERLYSSGVSRRNCPECGSPLTARFPYLPEQAYVPIGILDQPDCVAPEVHCHWESRVTWVQLHDDLPKETGSARDLLQGSPE